jgi:hypothetical protein
MKTFSPQPDVFIGSLRIQEPVTMITDVLVGLVCYFGFLRISAWGRTDPIFRCFRYYFLTMAIATCAGGIIGHGFIYKLGFFWKLPGWLISMFSITFIERASIEMCAPHFSRRFLRVLRMVNIVELLIFALAAFSTLDFLFVQIHSTYGLLVVVATLQAFNYRRTGQKGSRMMLIATGTLVLALVVFVCKRSFSVWFNHMDIAHMLMAAAAYLSYYSVKYLHTETPAVELTNTAPGPMISMKLPALAE